jgi:hypothetical protein
MRKEEKVEREDKPNERLIRHSPIKLVWLCGTNFLKFEKFERNRKRLMGILFIICHAVINFAYSINGSNLHHNVSKTLIVVI